MNTIVHGGGVTPYHAGMYAIFLYWLSRELFIKDGNGLRAEKVYYLNKVMNSIDVFYEVEMPIVWDVEHPLGSVMGRAKFGEYFFFYQGCTVGGSGSSHCYPVIGSHVLMCSHSKILGNTHIGDYVILSANVFIIDCDIPSDCIVFPSLDARKPIIVKKKRNEMAMKIQEYCCWKDIKTYGCC